MDAASGWPGRFIGLGITGSIAAFKAVDLLRLLRAEGADVQVLMTPSATRFVAPLTLAALSRRHVDAEVLDLLPDGRIGHVITADAADAILVAPATAHWLGAMAHGLAADVVTATCLATVRAGRRRARRWTATCTPTPPRRRTSRSCATASGTRSWSPRAGRSPRARSARAGSPISARSSTPSWRRSATGPCGARTRPTARRASRGPRPTRLARDADDLAGRHVVVTAGGTAEPIDPVRFIGNRSTGTMGVAVAEAARDRGARVTLVAGMVSVPLPEGVEVIRAETRRRDAGGPPAPPGAPAAAARVRRPRHGRGRRRLPSVGARRP